ncbi:MAG: DUF1330 domain-containing protein [Firmicutes bacterium HGW-Firmicutes-7]|nr:MAG: DUF1330 domain-containing protein [Firmicutes bacterium HGW-Firmicutes-7]
MSYYFVAQIKLEDETKYKKYLDKCDEVFAKFKGRYLSVDNNPEILEGDWTYSRLVLIEFESEKDLKEWYDSDSYQEILKYRLAGAHCDTIMVKGI